MFSLSMAGGAGPTTPTLVGPKIFLFMVKALYFQSSGRTNNCQIEVLFKWSDQSCTPSTAPAEGIKKERKTAYKVSVVFFKCCLLLCPEKDLIFQVNLPVRTFQQHEN